MNKSGRRFPETSVDAGAISTSSMPFANSRRRGTHEMKLHFLPGGRLRMRRSIYVPGAAKDETIELPVHSALVRHKQANLLFDTGCSPQAATDPERRWGGLARVMTPIFKAEETAVEQLSATGLTADDIDIVVCSHLHPDHCGCNEHFRRATIFCHAAELEAARAEGAEQQGYLPQEWNQPQGFRTFDSQHDVFGDGRLVLVPMPGHTPGSTVAGLGLIAMAPSYSRRTPRRCRAPSKPEFHPRTPGT